MAVLAVLNAASTATATNSTEARIDVIPEPITLIGDPTTIVFGETADLAASKVQYSFLVYQTYNAVGGATGMAQASGTTGWINLPSVSQDFPNISVSATSAGRISGSDVVFTVNGTVSYTKTTPALYKVVTEE